MTTARNTDKDFILVEGKSSRIIKSAEDVRIKQIAVIRFMAPSLGVRLLKTAILNIHPARSSKLKRSAKQTETHIKNCLAPELPDENNVVFGMPERLTIQDVVNTSKIAIIPKIKTDFVYLALL